MDEFRGRMVPDGLWEITEPLIPVAPKRAQGGGIPRADNRQTFAAIAFVLTTGCAWRHLPPTFGVSHQTAHRCFVEWSEAGLWAKLHRAVLDRLGAAGDIDWSRAIVDGASLRAKKGGSLTGPNPVDRGKAGSKIHVLTQRRRWSSAEARAFLESAREDGDPCYVGYVGVLALGLRTGEALGVGEDEVDLDGAQLKLVWQLQRLGKELSLNELKTDEAEDFLPLPGIYVTAVRLRLRQKERDRLAAGEAWQGSKLLLTTGIGTPLEPRTFARMWDRRCDLAGVPRMTRRDARRTCSSLLADLDVHPRVAMRILRHSKFDITMEVYTKVSDEATREALRRLGEELG